MPGKPGWPAPAASSSGPCSAYSYQLDGTQKGWCGSPASSGWPLAVRFPAIAQLLEPVSPSLPAASEPPSGRTRFSDASGVRKVVRSASGIRRAHSAASSRSMRPLSDHQIPRAMATTSETVKGSGS